MQPAVASGEVDSTVQHRLELAAIVRQAGVVAVEVGAEAALVEYHLLVADETVVIFLAEEVGAVPAKHVIYTILNVG